MTSSINSFRSTSRPGMRAVVDNYLSLLLLFVPPMAFWILYLLNSASERLQANSVLPVFPWQIYILIIAGGVATWGGVADWRLHREVLKMRMSQKERRAEALALGCGGIPMFILMWLATVSESPAKYLIPIIVILVITVTAICYDEFVFHRRRCGKVETRLHRLLVFGNGIAWLSWFSLIFHP
jgi:hypothetical protein